MRAIDIGVKFDEKERMDTSFMDSIMQTDVAESGLDNGDVWLEDNAENMQKQGMSNSEFAQLLEQFGISEKEFREW